MAKEMFETALRDCADAAAGPGLFEEAATLLHDRVRTFVIQTFHFLAGDEADSEYDFFRGPLEAYLHVTLQDAITRAWLRHYPAQKARNIVMGVALSEQAENRIGERAGLCGPTEVDAGTDMHAGSALLELTESARRPEARPEPNSGSVTNLENRHEVQPNDEPYRRRAEWLKHRLLERGWSTSDPYRQRGPDRKTVQKIIRGKPVRNDVLENLAEALSKKHGKVSVLDIPQN